MGYIIQASSGELYHHGILGQKWGKRNGPPYPLGANNHSSSEKKAGWRKSLSKSGDSRNISKSNKKFLDRIADREMKSHEITAYRQDLKLKTEQGQKADKLYSKLEKMDLSDNSKGKNREEEYNKILKEADRLNKEAEDLVKEQMNEKYGEKYLRDLERANKRDGALLVAGSVAAIPLLPVIIPIALVSSSIKNKYKKEVKQ